MQSLIKRLAEDSKEANIAEIIYQLSRLNQISKKQWQANQSVQNMGQLDTFISNAARRIREAGDKVISSDVLKLVTDLQRKIVNNKRINKQLNSLRREVQSLSKVDQETKKIIQIQYAKQKIQQQKQINLGNIAPPEILTTPFEKAIQIYEPILRNPPMPTTIETIPQSVRFLAKFAEIQNKIPIGTASNLQGSVYVGLQEMDYNGTTVVVPMGKNMIPETTIPDIPMQIKYHANRTINSWNKFVEREAEMIDFTKRITTSEDRNRYMEEQFRDLTIGTFSAQYIATLIYYYYYIPLVKYYKKAVLESLQMTEDSFLTNYTIGSSLNDNPLLLKATEAKKIVLVLLQGKVDAKDMEAKDLNVQGRYNAIFKILDDLKRTIASKNLNDLMGYVNRRTAQAYQFFRTAGVPNAVATKLIGNTSYFNVKERKLYFTQNIQNQQLTNLVKRVVKLNGAKNQVAKTDISLNWQSDTIVCHDYVWKNNMI